MFMVVGQRTNPEKSWTKVQSIVLNDYERMTNGEIGRTVLGALWTVIVAFTTASCLRGILEFEG